MPAAPQARRLVQLFPRLVQRSAPLVQLPAGLPQLLHGLVQYTVGGLQLLCRTGELQLGDCERAPGGLRRGVGLLVSVFG